MIRLSALAFSISNDKVGWFLQCNESDAKYLFIKLYLR